MQLWEGTSVPNAPGTSGPGGDKHLTSIWRQLEESEDPSAHYTTRTHLLVQVLGHLIPSRSVFSCTIACAQWAGRVNTGSQWVWINYHQWISHWENWTQHAHSIGEVSTSYQVDTSSTKLVCLSVWVLINEQSCKNDAHQLRLLAKMTVGI